MLILGGGPNRIGQGIEFDYCCCHASFSLRDAGYETIMMNSNPETVSTDYDTSSRLYFEPLTVGGWMGGRCMVGVCGWCGAAAGVVADALVGGADGRECTPWHTDEVYAHMLPCPSPRLQAIPTITFSLPACPPTTPPPLPAGRGCA